MILDIKKPIRTMDGSKARIIYTDLKGDYPIVAAIEFIPGHEMVGSFSIEGKYSIYYHLNIENIPEGDE